MLNLTLSDILTFPVATVSKNSPIKEVLANMRDNRISAIVVMEEERPIGIFTERDALMLAYHHHDLDALRVDEVMGKPLVTVLPHIDYREGYRILSEHNVRHLIVVNEYGKLEGIVSESDFMEHLDKGLMVQYKEVGALTTHHFITLPQDATVEDAVTFMVREHESYVIIEKNNQAIGIFTERDLVRLESKDKYNSSPCLEEVMTHPVSTVPAVTTLPEALKIMRNKRIRRLVVVDNKNHILGIVAYHDIVKKLYSPHAEHLMKKVEDQEQQLQAMESKLKKEREFRRIQKHLLESQRLAHIGSWELDLTTNHLWWSEETFHIFEIDSEKFGESYESFLTLVHPEDRDLVSSAYVESVANHTPYEIVHRLCFEDGRIKYVNEHCETFYDDSGKPIRSVGTVQDITKKQHIEEELSENKERLELFIKYAPAAIAMFDLQMRYIAVSHFWLVNYGLEDKDIIGQSHYDIFPEITQEWKNIHKRGMAGEVMREDNEQFKRADGTLHWMKREIRPWRKADGTIGGIVIFSEDMTERKQIENRYRLMFEKTGTCIAVVEVNGTFSIVNQTFAELAESTIEALEGSSFSVLIEESDRTKIESDHKKRLNGEDAPDHYEFTFLSTKGKRGTAILYAALIQETRQTIMSIIDITDRKNAEEALQNAYNLLTTIINTAPLRIFWKDTDLNYLGCNTVFAKDAGKLDSQEMIGKKDYDLSWKDQAELYGADDRQVMDSNIPKLSFDEPQTTPDGKTIWLRTSKVPLLNDKKETIGILGMYEDVTKRYELDKELQSSHDLLDKLTKNVPGALYQYRLYPDGHASFPYASNGIKEIYEVNPKEVIDDAQPVFSILHPDDLDEIMLSIQKSAQTMEDWNLEYRVDLPKKGVRWLEGLSKPEKLEDGSILWNGYIHDITDRKNTENELLEQKSILNYQAHHDDLTGLPNRVLFHDRLTQSIEKAKRNNSKIALLFIDLDNFKEINDSLGHDIGDEILKMVTLRLRKATRGEDTLARLGGDEFTVILEDLHQGQDASVISNKILESLSKSMNVNNTTLYVSCSIGISIYPDDGESAQNLLKFADSAMYKAKDEGRNNFQYYNTALTELAFEKVVMASSLRAGLKNNEFIVYYQPQVNGVTGTITGIEALARWNHPVMGLVSPAKFIPLAESTGLIVELDRYIMKIAMTQIVTWYKQGLTPGILAMNISVKQLQREDFIAMFKQLMKDTNCKAEWLELEVTESQIMTHPEEAIVILQAISNLGVELAVDDFGTGYSSLAYLKRLPIDKLKIDQAFVRDLPDDEEDAGITRAVIALAKSLNLKVIAEGVETREQRDFIVENGCEHIQGYLYSKPVPADELEALIKSSNVLDY